MQGLWVAIGILVAMPVMYDVSRNYVGRKEEDTKKGLSIKPSPSIAAFLNIILPGTGHMYSNVRRWNVAGAYMFTLYFFIFEVLLMYALGFPIIGIVVLLIINALLAFHVYSLLKRKGKD